MIANSRNPAPTDKERSHHLSTLNNNRGALRLIDEEIAKLHLQRALVQSVVATYDAILAPIRVLPDEILAEIFVCCLPEYRHAVMCEREAPMLLGRVCSLWREVAYNTPALWASLHAVVSLEEEDGRFDIRQEAIVTWLERSKFLPISVSLKTTDFPWDRVKHARLWPDRMHKAAMSILHFSNRLFHLEIGPDSLALSMLSDTDNSANTPSLLDTLVVTLESWDEAEGAATLLEAFLTRSSNLRRLCLSAHLPSKDTLDLAIPCSRLTHLHINTALWVNADQFTTFLRQFPELKEFSVKMEDGDRDVGDFTQPGTQSPTLRHHTVDLSHLETLNIFGCHPGQVMGQILSRLSMPRLRSLSCRFYRVCDNILYDENSFYLPNTPDASLQTLSLTISWKLCHGLSKYLAARQNIRRLEVLEWGPGITNDSEMSTRTENGLELLQSLTVTPDAPAICPKLEYLQWYFCRLPLDIHSIIRFIKSRSSANALPDGVLPLRKVGMIFVCDVSRADEQTLMEFAEQSMKVGTTCEFSFTRLPDLYPSRISAYHGLQQEYSEFSEEYPESWTARTFSAR